MTSLADAMLFFVYIEINSFFFLCLLFFFFFFLPFSYKNLSIYTTLSLMSGVIKLTDACLTQ